MEERVLKVLSFTERKAVKGIYAEVSKGKEFIICSKIADELKVTRSTLVNALKLLEAAGVLVTQSGGMKGTNITILEEDVFKQIAEA